MKLTQLIEASAIARILAKEKAGYPLTAEDQVMREAWIGASAENQILYQEIAVLDPIDLQTFLEDYQKFAHQDSGEALKRFKERYTAAPSLAQQHLPRKRSWAVAAGWAAALILVGFLSFLYVSRMGDSDAAHHLEQDPIYAGTEQAPWVRLGGGQDIILQSRATELHLEEHTLLYPDGSSTGVTFRDTIQLYNPKGSVMQIHLPDGSTAWLNSGTSLTYAPGFGKEKREVAIDGEASFTVEHDASRPFIVKSSRQRVEVLGTRFNLRDYPEKYQTSTSLLEGSIKIEDFILKPGEQMMIESGKRNVERFDPSVVTAWIEGKFAFTNADMGKVLEELESWYNVQIQFANKKQWTGTFTGKIDRNLSLQEVLQSLSKHQLSYRIENNTVIIE